MRAVLTALIAAIEAAAVALAGFAVVAVPSVLVWWLTFDMSAEPGEVLVASSGGWMLAHFVPLHFGLSVEDVLALGLGSQPLGFAVSLAPLGITVLTAVLAARSGWCFAHRGGVGAAGVLGGTLGFAGAAAVIATFGAPLRAWPLWLAVLVPALCFGVCSAAAFLVRAATAEHAWWHAAVRWIQQRVEPMNRLWAARLPARAADTVRLAAAAVVGLTGLAALGTAVALVAGYVGVITLSQSLQLDWIGLLVVFLLSAALLPVAFVWAIAWFTGSGFSIGAGTSVTPFETLLGPLPAFPLLGAVPHGWGWAGALAPAVVVLLGIGVGAYAHRKGGLRGASVGGLVVVVLVAAALVGLAVAVLAWSASGAIGPDRLAVAGPKPWSVGSLAALELGSGMLLGVLGSRLDLARVRRVGRTRAERLAMIPSQPGRAGVDADAETIEINPLRIAPAVPLTPQSSASPSSGSQPSTVQPSAMPVDPPQPAEAEDPLLRAFAWGSDEVSHEVGRDAVSGGERDADEHPSAGRPRRGWRPPWQSR